MPLKNTTSAAVTSDAVASTPDRSYRKLAADLLELIAQGEFVAGDRLPSERALADRFNVSRTSVREAIIALELQGAVEVRGGSGIYVAQSSAPSASAFVLQGAHGPFEVLRARSLIESEIAAAAAVHRTDADIDRIFESLSAMRQNMGDKAANDAADRQFHLGIAQATGNSILLQMVSALWDLRKGPLWTQIESHFHSADMRAASQEGHQRIFDALLVRDPDAARVAMRQHLERVIGQFAQTWR